MALREVLTYPNIKLKEESKEVTHLNEYIKQIISDLIDTMLSTTHSVGIAAPQIGEHVRLIVIDASRNKRCNQHNGQLIMINPEIVKHEGLIQFREGCMSIPDFTGNVNRAEKIVVNFIDENFQPKVLECSGFEAILIQHETDHLNGILFIDRVISRRTDLFKRKKY